MQTMYLDSSFSLFWQVLLVKAQKLNIGKPTLPQGMKLGKAKLSFMKMLKGGTTPLG